MMQAIFYKGTRPGEDGEIDRKVRELTHGPYSHSALLFSDGKVGEATNVGDAGVRLKKPIAPLSPDAWDFIALPDFNENAARQWFVGHLGDPYDYNGALRMANPELREDPNAWYCSEAVLTALKVTDPDPQQSTSNTVYDYLMAREAAFATEQGLPFGTGGVSVSY